MRTLRDAPARSDGCGLAIDWWSVFEGGRVGNAASTDLVLREFKARLLRKFLNFRIYSPFDQDDVFGEVVLTMWRRRNTFRHVPFEMIFFRVAEFTCLNFVRKRNRQPPVISLDELPCGPAEHPPLYEPGKFDHVLNLLDSHDRALLQRFAIRDCEGFTRSEIYEDLAQTYGISAADAAREIRRILRTRIPNLLAKFPYEED